MRRFRTWGNTCIINIKDFATSRFLVGNHGSTLSGIGRRYVSRGSNKVYSSRILNKMFDDLPSIGESLDSSLNNQIQKDEIKLLVKHMKHLISIIWMEQVLMRLQG